MHKYLLMIFCAFLTISPIAGAQQNFSWFGNQIIRNSTETIPSRRSFEGHFGVMRTSATRIDVSSESGANLDVYLMNAQQYQANRQQGGIGVWMKNEEGRVTQIIARLEPGEYYVLVANLTGSTQRASLRIWSQLAD